MTRKWLLQTASRSAEADIEVPVPSPKQLAWLLVQPIARLQPETRLT